MNTKLETLFPRIEAGEEVMPEMSGYRMKCCDCGLVHLVDFKLAKVVKQDGDQVWAEDHDDDSLRVVLKMTREDEPTPEGDQLLKDLDTLLSVQGRLMFARERYSEGISEAYGLAILEFMREYGMELRRRLAIPNEQGGSDEA